MTAGFEGDPVMGLAVGSEGEEEPGAKEETGSTRRLLGSTTSAKDAGREEGGDNELLNLDINRGKGIEAT